VHTCHNQQSQKTSRCQHSQNFFMISPLNESNFQSHWRRPYASKRNFRSQG
jgi:hypothetical protein